jgi:predicted chitinase
MSQTTHRIEHQPLFQDLYLSPIYLESKGSVVTMRRVVYEELNSRAKNIGCKLLYVYWPEQKRYETHGVQYGHLYARFVAEPRFQIITVPSECVNYSIKQLKQFTEGNEKMFTDIRKHRRLVGQTENITVRLNGNYR